MVVQQLPPEILLQIFERATGVPSELNIGTSKSEPTALSLFERCYTTEAVYYRQQVLQTRRTLPRVSKLFYALSIRFLYQSITVERGTRFLALLDTLEEDHKKDKEWRLRRIDPTESEVKADEAAAITMDASTEYTLAHFTKRLDLDISRARSWTKVPHERIMRLIHLLTNLEILDLYGPLDLHGQNRNEQHSGGGNNGVDNNGDENKRGDGNAAEAGADVDVDVGQTEAQVGSEDRGPRMLFDALKGLKNLKMLHLPVELSPSYAPLLYTLLTTPEWGSFNLQILESNLILNMDVPPELQIQLESPKEQKDEETRISSPPLLDPHSLPGHNFRAIDALNPWIRDASHLPHLFPNLRDLSLRKHGDPSFPAFIANHGHKITTVYVRIDELQVLVDYHQGLPSLRDVILNVNSRTFCVPSTSRLTPIPQVRRLGIAVLGMLPDHKRFDAAFRDLPYFFPQIECIRILYRQAVEQFQKQRPSRLRRWDKELRKRGIRLEREDGELLIECDDV